MRRGGNKMPKILTEEDNFSSFTWKDLPQEALAFIHQRYFTKEMSLEEYIATYFSNTVRGFKNEADRLFEEAKQECLAEGTFPEELQEIQTKIIIKAEVIKEKQKTSLTRSRPKDKNADKRASYHQKIVQKENEIDELRQLNQNIQCSNEQVMIASGRYIQNAEELLEQKVRYDSRQAQYEQSLFSEIQQQLRSKINLQNETLELTCKKEQFQQEEKLEQLYQERNALAW